MLSPKANAVFPVEGDAVVPIIGVVMVVVVVVVVVDSLSLQFSVFPGCQFVPSKQPQKSGHFLASKYAVHA